MRESDREELHAKESVRNPYDGGNTLALEASAIRSRRLDEYIADNEYRNEKPSTENVMTA